MYGKDKKMAMVKGGSLMDMVKKRVAPKTRSTSSKMDPKGLFSDPVMGRKPPTATGKKQAPLGGMPASHMAKKGYAKGGMTKKGKK